MFEQHSALRAAHERVADLHHRAQHHDVVRAVLAERRHHATALVLDARRADLAESELRAASAWHGLVPHLAEP